MDVISTSNPENSLCTPHTCKVPVKFKMMLAQGKRKSALESKCIHLKNAMFQLNTKEYPITVQKYLKIINVAIGQCLPHIAIYLAWCQVYIRTSFTFRMTKDITTEPEDVTCVISEK